MEGANEGSERREGGEGEQLWGQAVGRTKSFHGGATLLSLLLLKG